MLNRGGWEHTSTEFAPLSGFKPMEGYEEYSADFFDGKHYVLKGSSPYTPPSVARPSFRNFYQDVYPNPFAKFRCCR
jgi:formylglycine-generating enzyme required for sulfatase activity